VFLKLNKNKCLHDDTHIKEPDDAPDKPPTLLISVVVVLSFLSVFAVVAISFPVAEKLGEAREELADTGMGNSTRMNYLTSEKRILSSYQELDGEHYQIPIEQSMKIVVSKQGDVFTQDEE
jgi:hypothetical protein